MLQKVIIHTWIYFKCFVDCGSQRMNDQKLVSENEPFIVLYFNYSDHLESPLEQKPTIQPNKIALRRPYINSTDLFAVCAV